MDISLPWNRQQLVVLASLANLSKLYQALGDRAATHVHMSASALRERALSYGARVFPSASHQVLAVFGSPRKALDWIEQAPTIMMAVASRKPTTVNIGLVVAFDCADTSEVEGMLHSAAVPRLERLLWGRSDEVVFADTAIAVIPEELKGRISRVAAPRELGAVWRIGIKETSVMSDVTTQIKRSDGAKPQAGETAEVHPVLRLELLDRRIDLNGLDGPLIVGRNVVQGMAIPDPRVSRVHARIEPRGNHFAVVDSSSNGTWVQFQGHPTPIELRQQECLLRGRGVLSFGAEPHDFSAPTVGFSVTIPTGFGNSGFNASGFEGLSTRGASLLDE
jgi:adenylate cyclase